VPFENILETFSGTPCGPTRSPLPPILCTTDAMWWIPSRLFLVPLMPCGGFPPAYPMYHWYHLVDPLPPILCTTDAIWWIPSRLSHVPLMPSGGFPPAYPMYHWCHLVDHIIPHLQCPLSLSHWCHLVDHTITQLKCFCHGTYITWYLRTRYTLHVFFSSSFFSLNLPLLSNKCLKQID